MAIQFYPNIRNLLIGRGILASGITAASGITVYSGTQPTAPTILANWAAYNSANSSFLCHFTGAVWIQPLYGLYASIGTFPVATVATNSGSAAWCIIWTTNPLLSAMGTATIPTTSFIVGPVTTLAGTGIVRFSPDVTMTSGVASTIADGLITASSF